MAGTSSGRQKYTPTRDLVVKALGQGKPLTARELSKKTGMGEYVHKAIRELKAAGRLQVLTYTEAMAGDIVRSRYDGGIGWKTKREKPHYYRLVA